ncbi:hypothetical protein ON010_g4211 [Phytophthora cinnamomi]|nr:hypothetical protein ON010_g4211 [Phytophthora cinnamomi]
MASLQDGEDARVLEAALRFVDECFLDTSATTAETLLPPAAILAAAPLLLTKNEQSSAESSGGPSFSIACREAAAMEPLGMKIGDNSAELLQLSFPTEEELDGWPQASSLKKVAANPNRVRDQIQYEVAYLREKVAELELQLRTLQITKGVPRRNPFTKSSVPRCFGEVPRVWKEVASRQQRRRDQAKRENVRLRIIVERKKKMATGLTALLHKQLAQQATECLRGKGQHYSERLATCVLDFRGDIGGFSSLFQILRSAYHEVETVFTSSGLVSMEIPINDVHVREDVDGKYIEVFSNKLLPFSLCDTGEAAWNHSKGVEKHFDNGGLYEKAAKNLDQPYTIIEDFTKEMFSNNSRADVRTKQIVQRIVEPDRDVILFVSSVTPTEIKNKPLDGLVYHAREYTVIKRFSESTPEHEISLLQLYARLSFDYKPGVEYDLRHVRSVIQFLKGNFGGSLRCYQDRVENALVDQARVRLD